MWKMKENMTQKILEGLSEVAGLSSDLIIGFLSAGYGASRKQLERATEKAREARHELFDDIRKRNNFYTLLSKLKREGLVVKEERGWAITKRGAARLDKIRSRLPTETYDKKKDATLKMVIFDIPETDRLKRDWLRKKLVELGFEILQKSVWKGKVQVPEEFIKILDRIDLLKHIHIFEITKTGSLVELE